jgi:hypothetical protein
MQGSHLKNPTLFYKAQKVLLFGSLVMVSVNSPAALAQIRTIRNVRHHDSVVTEKRFEFAGGLPTFRLY